VRHNAPKRTVVYFHGNSQNLKKVVRFVRFASRELEAEVYALEYPGYWEDGGQPSETAFYKTAEVFARAVVERATTPVVFLGYSLGAAPALRAAVASRRPAALLAPFVSAGSVRLGRWRCTLALNSLWAPLDLFRTLPLARRMESPLLVVHGTADTVIPHIHGKVLSAAAPVGEFVAFEGADHSGLELAGLDAVLDFLNRL
jgi:hypothetical protein